MSFQGLSDEEIAFFAQTAEKIAEQVAKNSLECSANRINIVGPYASVGEKKHGIFVERGGAQVINCDSTKNSFIFNGLDDVFIRVRGKTNHVLIRDCRHTKIQIDDGVISGVTIFKGKKVIVNLPEQNTTALEQTLEATVKGRVTPNTIIYVTASQDIIINHENLHVHPFVQGVFTKGFFFPTRYIPPELQIMNEAITQVIDIGVVDVQ